MSACSARARRDTAEPRGRRTRSDSSPAPGPSGWLPRRSRPAGRWPSSSIQYNPVLSLREGDLSPGGELAQGVAVEAPHGPLVLGHGPGAPVEVVRAGVPVEHPPLQPRPAALDALRGQRLQQRAAEAEAAVLGSDEQVLEPDAVPAARCCRRWP